MIDVTVIELRENLKALSLSTVVRELETTLRQAKEQGASYETFLLQLTTAELQARAENRLNRRVREAKFPQVKILETFDFNATVGLDIRLIRELVGCDYIKERRNLIFLKSQRCWEDSSVDGAWRRSL